MSPSARSHAPSLADHAIDHHRAISALLSQVLVAFTVELDNEFELRMTQLGFAGGRLSVAPWLNVLRFVGANPVAVSDLAVLSLVEQTLVKHMLGCLERWGFVRIDVSCGMNDGVLVDQKKTRPGLRDGFGSGRGINARTTVELTTTGVKAREVWKPLPQQIEDRWRKRFGFEAANDFREALEAIQEQLEFDLPQGLVDVRWRRGSFPARTKAPTGALPLGALMSQLLIAFAIEFEPKSDAPLALCANTIRVLSDEPTPEAALPRLTGCSPEMCGPGWQLKPFVSVARDLAAKRGKALRLTPRGLLAQQRYTYLTAEIEEHWESRFGQQQLNRLRNALLKLFDVEGSGSHPLLISEGLAAPPGVVRSGDAAPALGRRDVGSAALKRMRDMVLQTEAFVADPVHALPHYPMLDMNRGFGP